MDCTLNAAWTLPSPPPFLSFVFCSPFPLHSLPSHGRVHGPASPSLIHQQEPLFRHIVIGPRDGHRGR